MTRDASVYLRHIRDCAEPVAAYTAEGRGAFFVDTKTQDAVIRNLEIIGQAVKDLGPDQLAGEMGEIPWQQVAGFRNVLAHQYLGVDLKLVWNVIEEHLPALRRATEILLARRDGGA